MTDDSQTLSSLTRLALPELHELAAKDRVLAIPPITWTIEDHPDGIVLVGSAAAVRIDDLCPA